MGGGISVGFWLVEVAVNFRSSVGVAWLHKTVWIGVNASLVATGAELSQGGYPVAFNSKKLSPAETQYHVGDRELLAIFQACMKWRSYLHGNRCKVYTDHDPLIYVYTKLHLNAR